MQRGTVKQAWAYLSAALIFCNGLLHADEVKPPQDSLETIRAKADAGDPVAQEALGHRYLTDEKAAVNYLEAKKWLDKSAAQGNADAQFQLGEIFRKGLGVPQDLATALHWYHSAAENGQRDAAAVLGSIYWNGHGVPKNVSEGLLWTRTAANLGDAPSLLALGLACRDGIDMPKDTHMAFVYFVMAASSKSGPAALIVAQSYLSGDLVPASELQAYHWALIGKKLKEPGCDPLLASLTPRISPAVQQEEEQRATVVVDETRNNPVITYAKGNRAEFHFDDLESAAVIKVKIGNAPPLKFLLDSGADLSVITETAAKKLGLVGDEVSPVVGYGGKPTLAHLTPPLTLSLPGLDVSQESLAIIATPDDTFDGLIGLDVLLHMAMTVDWHNQIISAQPPLPVAVSGMGSPVPVEITTDGALVHISLVNEHGETWPLTMVLDTGNNSMLVISNQALAHRPFFLPDYGTTERIVGISGASEVRRTRCHAVKFGTNTVDSPMILVVDTPFAQQQEGGVGSGLLRRFAVTLDFANKRLFLRPGEQKIVIKPEDQPPKVPSPPNPQLSD